MFTQVLKNKKRFQDDIKQNLRFKQSRLKYQSYIGSCSFPGWKIPVAGYLIGCIMIARGYRLWITSIPTAKIYLSKTAKELKQGVRCAKTIDRRLVNYFFINFGHFSHLILKPKLLKTLNLNQFQISWSSDVIFSGIFITRKIEFEGTDKNWPPCAKCEPLRTNIFWLYYFSNIDTIKVAAFHKS